MLKDNIQVLALTETRMMEGDEPLIVDLCPANYRMIQKPRPVSKGSRSGGVGLVIADRISCDEMSSDELKYVTFEVMMVRIQLHNSLLLVILNRPACTIIAEQVLG